jgi:hypothetical protein
MRAPTPTLLHYLNRSVRDQKGLGRTLRGAWHVGAGTTVVVAGGAIGGPFPAAWATCCCGPSCSQAMHRKRRHLSPLRDLPTRPSCSMSRPGPYECLRADSLASALSSGQARPSPRRLGLEGSLRFVTLATAGRTAVASSLTRILRLRIQAVVRLAFSGQCAHQAPHFVCLVDRLVRVDCWEQTMP